MTPTELKSIRNEFCFTQKKIAEILGMSESSYRAMELGTRPIPKYNSNPALVLPLLNHNKLLREYLKIIGVELKEDKEND